MNFKKTPRFWILTLLLATAATAMLAPARAQEEPQDPPRVVAVVPGATLQVIEISTLTDEVAKAFTVPPRAPLQIVDLSVFPKPHIGRIVTLHVEVMSVYDEPDAVILIDLPKGVKLVQGSLLWRGALRANQVQTHEISIRVLEEGDWRLHIETYSILSENSSYEDSDTLHLIATSDAVEVVSGSEYRIIQPPEGMPMPEIPPENASVTMDLSARASTTGTVTLEGDFEFIANEDDGPGPGNPITNTLKRVKIEVWDYEPTGDRRLGKMTYTPGAGYSVTVDNDDPDGSGIDPFLKIYITDEERVEVVDEANQLVTAQPDKTVRG